MVSYVNDLRLSELATGEGSGSWGTTTNTNLELIGEAFSFGTEAITTNADTHTTTIADGSTDPGRSMFLKYTGTLDSTCTITIGPNTVSKLWFIENATSGSQSIIIKQGSGATITIANGQTKAIYSDGAGSGGAMVDAFTDLSVPSFFVSGDLDVDGTANLDVVDIDGAVDFASTTAHAGNATFADNAKAIFGAGSDLQIYHDGSASYIDDAGTGNLRIRANSSLSIQKYTGETMGVFTADGSVLLAHDNATKFETTSTGIDVTGTVVSDGLTVDGTSQFNAAVTITETGTGSSAGPFLNLHRDSSSPADSDLIGIIQFQGEDDGSNVTAYGTIAGKIADVTGGTEDGVLLFNVIAAGSSLDALTLSHNEAVFNNGSADYDFRVESNGNTHALYVNAGSDGVGMGATSSPVNESATEGLFYSIGGSLTVASNTETLQINRNNTGGNDRTNIGLYNNGTIRGTIGTLGGQDGIYFQSGGNVDNLQLQDGLSVFNESSADIDFRVESNNQTHAFFIDAGADRIGINQGAPSAALDIITTVTAGADALRLKQPSSSEIYQLQLGVSGATNEGLYLRNTQSTGQLQGWTASEVVINDDSADRDFRVESDANAYMFYVDAGLDAIGVGTSLGSSYQATQQGMLQVRNGGSEGSPEGSGGIEFYAAQANNGYSHRLCAFDNTGGDTPLLLQRRNNSATWSTQVTFEGANNNVVFAGTVSKGGGSFKIDHPLPSMNGTHHLVHSFIEGPQADNLYRGRVSLVAGQASVNLDAASNMTEGTFVLLNRDLQCFTSNETGWTPVKGTVTGNTLLIEAQDNTCTDTISWMVVGERQDQFMYDNEFADEDGHIIVEPLKKPHQQSA